MSALLKLKSDPFWTPGTRVTASIIGIILCVAAATLFAFVHPFTRSWFKESHCEALRDGNLITRSDLPFLDELELLEKSPLWTPKEVENIIAFLRSERVKADTPTHESETEEDRLSQLVLWMTAINVIDSRLRPPRIGIDDKALAAITDALVIGLSDPDIQTRTDFALILIDCRLIVEPRVRRAVENLLNDPDKSLASNIRRQLAWYDMGRSGGSSSEH